MHVHLIKWLSKITKKERSVNHFDVIMVHEFRTLLIPEPFHFQAVLMTRVALPKLLAIEQN